MLRIVLSLLPTYHRPSLATPCNISLGLVFQLEILQEVQVVLWHASTLGSQLDLLHFLRVLDLSLQDQGFVALFLQLGLDGGSV